MNTMMDDGSKRKATQSKLLHRFEGVLIRYLQPIKRLYDEDDREH